MNLILEVLALAFTGPYLPSTLALLIILAFIVAMLLVLMFATRPNALLEAPPEVAEPSRSLALQRAQEAARRQLVEAGQAIDLQRGSASVNLLILVGAVAVTLASFVAMRQLVLFESIDMEERAHYMVWVGKCRRDEVLCTHRGTR